MPVNYCLESYGIFHLDQLFTVSTPNKHLVQQCVWHLDPVPLLGVVPPMEMFICTILKEAQSMQPLLKAGNCSLGSERRERQEHPLSLTQTTPLIGRFSSWHVLLDTSSVPLMGCKAKDYAGWNIKALYSLPSSCFFKVISIIDMYPLSQGKTVQPVPDSGIDHLAGEDLHAGMCASSCEQAAMSVSSWTVCVVKAWG